MLRSKKQVLSIALLLLLSLAALVSLGRVLSKGQAAQAIDFRTYWYAGHFLWQGYDPYEAALDGKAIPLLRDYVDGQAQTEGDVARFEALKPTNTAPIALLVAPLSRLSWPSAFKVWASVNLGLTLLVLWLAMTLLRRRLLSREGLFLGAVLFSLIATRGVIENGQTSMLVLACMLAALVLGRQRPLGAGILLGIALSKYSLAFPAFLLFAYKRWYKGMAVSIVVQLLGIIAVSAISHSTPQDVLVEYFGLMALHVGNAGMHLSAGLLKGFGAMGYLIIGLGSVGLFAALAHWYRVGRDSHPDRNYIVEYHLFTILMLWSLLTFYHGWYDNVAIILFVALVVLCVKEPGDEKRYGLIHDLSSRQRAIVYAITGSMALIWILPTYLILGEQLNVYAFNVSTVVALVLSVWLLFKVRLTDKATRNLDIRAESGELRALGPVS